MILQMAAVKNREVIPGYQHLLRNELDEADR